MIRVGMVFRGFCGGAFGRDAYGPKRVESFGADWIVVRDDHGLPRFARMSESVEYHDGFESVVARWLMERE